jgi:hypothetical protein
MATKALANQKQEAVKEGKLWTVAHQVFLKVISNSLATSRVC